MSKYKWSENFFSLEGEAQYAGHPTMYTRFAQCNFKCPGFNNPSRLIADNGYAAIDFDPKNYTTLADLPLITRGCDSQYSVSPEFSHLWTTGTVDQLIDELLQLSPTTSFVSPSGRPYIWSLTGGEPTMLGKKMSEVINHPRVASCTHILIETNCSVPLHQKFVEGISQWLSTDSDRKWTWSNSPKLSASGEDWNHAIVPDVAFAQHTLSNAFPGQVEQYFKFVVGPREEDFVEVANAMAMYYACGIPRTTPVWIMPEACTHEQQQSIDKQVARMCMDKGYLFCYRFQNALWGNGVGT